VSRVDPIPKLNTCKEDQTETSAKEQEDNASISEVENSANKLQRSPRSTRMHRYSAIVADLRHLAVLAQ
jgi:hypothetical protein